MANALLEAIDMILNHEPVSDFMSSYSIVREIQDLVTCAYLCKCGVIQPIRFNNDIPIKP